MWLVFKVIQMFKFLEIDQEAFQEMIQFYGNIYHLPPLASKIFSYMVFDFEKRGVTFDELLEFFAVSKSSISSSISLLVEKGLIINIQKSEERKRYYHVNPNSSKIRFEEILKRLEQESLIVDKLKSFKDKHNKAANCKEYTQHYIIYKNFLEKGIENFKDTLTKLSTNNL